jgi:PKD repeat protein
MWVQTLTGQPATHFCGVMPPHTATSTNRDSIVYDRFGNSYDISDLLYTPPVTTTPASLNIGPTMANGSYFFAQYFESSTDTLLTDSMKHTIELVFAHLSHLIERRSFVNGCGEEIPLDSIFVEVRYAALDITPIPEVLGTGSPYIHGIGNTVPASRYLQHDRPYVKINGGYELGSLTQPDIKLEINNRIPNFHSLSGNDINQEPCPANQFDLYSVVLHEMLHGLGFYSMIGDTGEYNQNLPQFSTGQRSFFESNLRFGDGSDTIQPLFKQVANNQNGFNLDPMFGGLLPNLHNVVMNTAGDSTPYVFYFGADSLIRMTSGNPYGGDPDLGKLANQLSHFQENPDVTNSDLVMQSGYDAGTMHRVVSNREKQVLQRLGYRVMDNDSTLFMGVDPDFLVVHSEPMILHGHKQKRTCCEKQFTTCKALDTTLTTFNISIPDLICNDYLDSNIVFIDIIAPAFGWNYTISLDTIALSYNGSSCSQFATFAYDFVYTLYHESSGLTSNGTFHLYVKNCDDISIDSPTCFQNLILEPSFDSLSCNGVAIGNAVGNSIFGIEGAAQNSVDISSDPIQSIATTNRYIGFGSTKSDFESFSLELGSVIPPGSTIFFQMGLHVSKLQDSINIVNWEVLNIVGSKNAPCHINDAFISPLCSYPDSIFCNDSISFKPFCLTPTPLGVTDSLAGTPLPEQNYLDLSYVVPIYFDTIQHNVLLPGFSDSIKHLTFFVQVDPTIEATIYALIDNIRVAYSNEHPEFTYSQNCGQISFETDSSCGSHLWLFGDGDTSFVQNPEHTYGVNGTYLVSHEITFTVFDSTYVVFDTNSITIDCYASTYDTISCSTFSFSSNYPAGVVHHWAFGDGVTSSLPNPMHSYAAEDGYTVMHTVTDTISGLTNTETLYVDVDCPVATCSCESPLNFGLDGIQDISLQSLIDQSLIQPSGSNTFSGLCIGINGTLIIDVNGGVTFEQCEFKMAPGSKIVVQTMMGLVNSTMQGCDTMWSGITVEQGAILTFIGNDLIADAENLITAKKDCQISLSGNLLWRNYRVLRNDNGVSNFGLTFVNNWVSGIDPITLDGLKPAFIGQVSNPAATGNIGYCAIDFSGVNSFVIGGAGTNYISNLHNGILAKACNFVITDTRFENISFYANNFFETGNAIHALGNAGQTMIVKGLGIEENDFNTFFNVNQAIKSIAMNSEISQCKMDSVIFGIKTGNTQKRNTHIFDNAMHCKRMGIVMGMNGNCFDLQIHNNSIWVGQGSDGSTVNYGIAIFDGGIPKGGHIDDNIIRIYNKSKGIEINAGVVYNLKNNVIRLMSPLQNLSGMEFNHCTQIYAYCNTLDGESYGGDFDKNIGIVLWGGEWLNMDCNYLRDTRTGLRVTELCSKTELRGNDFDGQRVGLHLTNTGTFDSVHTNMGNRFGSDYASIPEDPSDSLDNPFAAWNQNSNPASIAESKFDVSPGVYFPIPVFPPAGWFSALSGDEFTCPADCQYQEVFLVGGGGGENAFDNAIAQGVLSYPQYNDPLVYAAQKYLYAKLAENPGLIDNNVLLAQFWSDMESGVISDFYDIKVTKEDAFLVADAIKLTLSSLQDENKSLLEQMTSLLQNLPESPTEAQIEAFKEQKAVIDLQLKETKETITAIDSTLLVAILPVTNTLLVQNKQIVTSQSYEDYEKIVNEIYLLTLGQDNYDLTTLQEQSLMSIASLCPLAGGRSVLIARSLLMLANGVPSYDDYSICSEAGYQALQVKEHESFARVFPNPASDLLNVEYRLQNDATIKVFDLYGRLIFSDLLISDNEFSSFSVIDVSPGLHYCVIVGSDEKIIVSLPIYFQK